MNGTRFQPGDVLDGQLEIKYALRGGVCDVYLCRHRNGRHMALKTLQPQFAAEPRMKGAFRNEGLIWIELGQHPNIVTCEFVSIIYGQTFLDLEWIVGPNGESPDLGLLMEGQRSRPETMLTIGLHVCAGLIHAAGRVPSLVHGDLKPSNILIGSDRVARITDFGMAHSTLNPELKPADLGAGGTPRYMAPEQWTGAALDARTDVYALGCVLFEGLAGHSVYAGPRLEDYRRQHLTARVPLLDRTVVDEASGVGPLLARCMAKDPGERPLPAELLTALSAIYELATGKAPAPPVPPNPPSAREWSNRGTAYATLGKSNEALAAFTKALEIEPGYAHARAMRGSVLLKLKRTAEGLRDLDQAVEDDPNLAVAWLNRARAYDDLGRPAEAFRSYESAIEKDPRLTQAYLGRGELLESQGQFNEALADYETAIKIDPLQAEGWRRRGSLCADLRRGDDAIHSYSEAIRLAGTATDYWRRALAYYVSGNDLATIEDASAAIRLDAANMPAYLIRGHARRNLSERSNDIDAMRGAFEDYSKAIQVRPDTALDAYIGRGILLSRNYNEEAAIADFTRALELDDQSIESYRERGFAYLDTKRFPEAIADFDRAIALKANSATLWKARGDAHRGSGSYQKAISDYRQALELAPEWDEILVGRAQAFQQLNNYKLALKDLNRAITLNPKSAQAYRVRSEVHGALGHDGESSSDYGAAMHLSMQTVTVPMGGDETVAADEPADDTIAEDESRGPVAVPLGELRERAEALLAARRYREASAAGSDWIAADGDDADAWQLRGYAKSKLGDLEAGIEDYSRAIALRRGFALANNNRGVAYQKLGRHTEAIADFNHAIEIEPGYAMVYINRGGSRFSLGDAEQALADMTKGIELDPKELAGYPDRAAVNAKLGRIHDAMADLQHALRIDPDYGPAYLNLGVLTINSGDTPEGLRMLQRAESLGVAEARGIIVQVEAALSQKRFESGAG